MENYYIGTALFLLSVSAALAEAMTMKFSMPRHRYTTLKPSSSPDPAVCEVCQAEFSSPQLLQPHKLCHFNTCHVCYVCDTYFTHADTMTLHMATIHRNLNPTGQALNDDGREWFICPVCLQRFVTNTGLSKHQTSHVALESNYGCRVCGLDFVGSRALMAHLSSSRHNEMKVKMQGVFVCVDCRSIFASRDAYAMHMMLRAQNETCAGPETKPIPVVAPPIPSPIKADGMSNESHSDTSVTGSSSKPPSRSSSVIASSRNNSPLNLTTTTPATTPTQQYPSFAKPAYTCAKCLATFANQEAMAVHLVMHSAMEKGQEFRLSTWAAARPNSAPVGVMHPNKSHSPWMCGRCLVAFDTCDSLAMHMMTKHANEPEQERVPQTAQSSNLQQTQSSPQGQMLGSVSRNEELMSKLAGLHNGQFGKRTRRSSVQSNDSDHLGPTPKRCKSSSDTPNSPWFECPACKQMFSARMEWYKHVLVCSQQQQHKQQSHHEKGPSTHNGQQEQTSECETCNMVFVDSHSLHIHYRSQHHKDQMTQQLICHYCRWSASDQQSLLSHLEGHDDRDAERPDKVTSSGHQQNTTEDDDVTGEHGEGKSSSRGETGNHPHREPLNLVCGDRQDLDPAEFAGKGIAVAGEQSMALQQLIDRCDADRSTTPKALPGSTTSGTSGVGSSAEDSCEGDIIDYVLTHAKDLAMCKYCKIVYTDKTLYCLHMGLHNLNNPWQCNMCGKVCHDIHEFTSHVIHF